MISEIFNASDLILSYTKLMTTFNSCVNPIIYGVKHPHFRQIFGNILFRRWNKIPEPAFGWMKSSNKTSLRVDIESNFLQVTDDRITNGASRKDNLFSDGKVQIFP